MTEPKRLFDCLQYHLEREPIADMLAGKENNQWIKYSTGEIKQIVDDLSSGLLSLGLGSGDKTPEGRDKIAILSRNRPEWIFLDLAVQQIGAVLVPVYPTIKSSELEFILNDAAIKFVFVDNEITYQKVADVAPQVPSLQGIYSFDKMVEVSYWKDIIAKATPAALVQVRDIAADIDTNDIVTLIYTSGTTGNPKGVMLSHKNVLSNLMNCMEIFPPGDKYRSLSFLPLNHILERMGTYFFMYRGCSVYFADSIDTLSQNLLEVKPLAFITVPRLLEKVYEKIMSKGLALKGIKKKIFFWAHGLGERYEINTKLNWWYNIQLRIANKLVFKKWRDALGGHVQVIITGGASCQVKMLRIFTAAGIPVQEGYGLTECSPVVCGNGYKIKDRKFGSVGNPINNVQIKIAEDGEILCKGDNVMMGYYKQPELTAQAISNDGWLHTGDIGEIDAGFLKITDRKKELFKTSGGKYVAPLPIENKLKESLLIDNVIVVGAERKFVSALVVPSFSALEGWCKRMGIPYTTPAEIINHPKVVERYNQIVTKFNQYFNHVEQVKKIVLLPACWSIETGEITPKLSLKRKVIEQRHQDIIDRLYAG